MSVGKEGDITYLFPFSESSLFASLSELDGIDTGDQIFPFYFTTTIISDFQEKPNDVSKLASLEGGNWMKRRRVSIVVVEQT